MKKLILKLNNMEELHQKLIESQQLINELETPIFDSEDENIIGLIKRAIQAIEVKYPPARHIRLYDEIFIGAKQVFEKISKTENTKGIKGELTYFIKRMKVGDKMKFRRFIITKISDLKYTII